MEFGNDAYDPAAEIPLAPAAENPLAPAAETPLAPAAPPVAQDGNFTILAIASGIAIGLAGAACFMLKKK